MSIERLQVPERGPCARFPGFRPYSFVIMFRNTVVEWFNLTTTTPFYHHLRSRQKKNINSKLTPVLSKNNRNEVENNNWINQIIA